MIFIIKLAGHRGYKEKELENTKAAFLKAIEENLNYIEFDIRKSMDNIPIIFHDETLNRIIKNVKEKIENLNVNQLKSFKYDDGQEILTLDELFSLTNGRVNYILDLRDSGIEHEIIHLIRKYKLERHIIVQSRIKKSIKKLYKIAPDLEYALYLGYMGKPNKWSNFFRINKLLALIFYYARIKRYPVKYLSSDGQYLYYEIISLVQKKGIKVILGAIKLENYIKCLKKWKVDIITTNNAENTKKLLKKHKII